MAEITESRIREIIREEITKGRADFINELQPTYKAISQIMKEASENRAEAVKRKKLTIPPANSEPIYS